MEIIYEDNDKDKSVKKDPQLLEPSTDPEYHAPHGGKRPGAGRPRGSKNAFSKHSVERLKELNFDPLEKMIELYAETTLFIAELDNPPVGKTGHNPEIKCRKYSGQAFASLLITKQKIINDLLRYGYRFVPEKQEITTTERKPMSISLTGLAPVVPLKPAADTNVGAEKEEMENKE